MQDFKSNSLIDAAEFERKVVAHELILKHVDAQGYSTEGLSFWDIFGVPGGGATHSSAQHDIKQLRGWNAAGVMANSYQSVMSTVHVFTSPEEAARIQYQTGENAQRASRVTGIEHYKVPSDWVQAPINHRVSERMTRPNPWEDEAVFKCKISQQMETHGVAYLLVLPNQYGAPMQIHVVPKAQIQPEPVSTQFPEGSYRTGQLSKLSMGWSATADNDTPETHQEMLAWLSNRTFSANYVIPIGIPSLMHSDDFFNPTGSMADFLTTDEEMHRSRRQTMQNNTTNGPMIEKLPHATIDPEEWRQVEEAIHRQYGGPENQGKPLRVPDGLKITDRGYNAREMEYAASTEQMREDMLALRGVPPSFFGVGTTSGYAGVVGEVKAYAFMRSQPLQRIVSGQITLGLQRFFTGAERDFMVVFQAAQLDDPDQKLAEMQMHISAGVLTKGVYCDMMNLDRFGDERDDEVIGTETAGGMPGIGGDPDQPGIGSAAAEVETTMSPEEEQANFHSLKRGEFSNTRKGIEETLREYSGGAVRPSVAVFLLQQLGVSEDGARSMVDEIDEAKASEQAAIEQKTATEQLKQSVDAHLVAKSFFDDLFLKMNTDSGTETVEPIEDQFDGDPDFDELTAARKHRQPVNRMSGSAPATPIDLRPVDVAKAMELPHSVRNRRWRFPESPGEPQAQVLERPELDLKRLTIDSIMSRVMPFTKSARGTDGDGDGFVYDGTPQERPVAVKDKPQMRLRKDMPQIRNSLMDGFVDEMAEQGIETTMGQQPSGDLKPIQSELSEDKINGMVEAHEAGEFNVAKKPVTVSNDGYIADGHHRWAAAQDLDLDINTREVDLPIEDLLTAMENHETSFKEDVSQNRAADAELIDPSSWFDDEAIHRPGFKPTSEQKTWAEHKSAATENMDKSEDSWQAALNLGEGVSDAIGADVVGYEEAVERAGKNDSKPMVLIAPIKGAERAKEKVTDKYGGDWSRLTDVVRGTVSVPGVDDLESTVTKLNDELTQRGWKVAAGSVENKFANPTPVGYRDLALLARAPNGQLAELQVQLHSMLHAKETKGHKLYESYRKLEGKRRRTGKLTDKEKRDIVAISKQQIELYSQAWETAKKN